MREWVVLGLTIEEQHVPEGAQLEVRLEDERNFSIHTVEDRGLNLEDIRTMRVAHISEHGQDPHRMYISTYLANLSISDFEGLEMRERETEALNRFREAGSAWQSYARSRGLQSTPVPAEDDDFTWPGIANRIWFLGRTRNLAPTVTGMARRADFGGEEYVVRLRVPAIDIAYLVNRTSAESARNAKRRARLELFRWLQQHVRDSFETQKNDHPEVCETPFPEPARTANPAEVFYNVVMTPDGRIEATLNPPLPTNQELDRLLRESEEQEEPEQQQPALPQPTSLNDGGSGVLTGRSGEISF